MVVMYAQVIIILFHCSMIYVKTVVVHRHIPLSYIYDI